jgi:hypothetical protein
MNDAEYKKADIRLKWVVLFGSTVAFICGMYEYRENAEREFKKPFLEKQIQVCQDVTSLVGNFSLLTGN